MRILFVALVILAVFPATSMASTPPPYRSDAQAEHYLEHGLKRWAGIDLTKPGQVVSAFCINGWYSTIEKRTRHHFTQGKTNRYGEPIFASFACTLSVDDHSYNLYLRTRWGTPAWIVQADR